MKASLVVTGIAAGIGIALAGAGSAFATADTEGTGSGTDVKAAPSPTEITWNTGGEDKDGTPALVGHHEANPFVGDKEPLSFLFTGDKADAVNTAWAPIVKDFTWGEPKWIDATKATDGVAAVPAHWDNFGGFNFDTVKEAGFGGNGFGAYDLAVLDTLAGNDKISTFLSSADGHELNAILGIVPGMQAFDAALFTDLYAAVAGAITPEELGTDLFGAGDKGADVGLFTGLFSEEGLGAYFGEVFDFSGLDVTP